MTDDVDHHVYEEAVPRILEWFHKAEDVLLGHNVVTFNGESGVVKEVRLDEQHGLCFTIDELPLAEARRFFPVSTIRHKETS